MQQVPILRHQRRVWRSGGITNHDLEYVTLHVYAVTHALPVESGLGGFGVQSTPRVPFTDFNLIVMLVYTVIFWSFSFFSCLKMDCFLGEVRSAAALWDSFVCSVFRDGLVYEYPWMRLVVFFVLFSCVFCCSLIWVMLGKRSYWHPEGVGMEYIQISIACLHIPTYLYYSTHNISTKISRLLIYRLRHNVPYYACYSGAK